MFARERQRFFCSAGDKALEVLLASKSRESAKALRKQIAQAESEMKRLSQQRAEIDEMLSRPNANGASVAELMKSRSEVERSLASAEQSWIEASEAVERSQG